jgi:hypothetical protein
MNNSIESLMDIDVRNQCSSSLKESLQSAINNNTFSDPIFQNIVGFSDILKSLKQDTDNPVHQFDLINSIERQINQTELTQHDYALIPLGWDCLPRTIMTRWGVKKSKAEGELSCPFDLIFTPFDSTCNLIQYDFQDFLNSNYLEASLRNDGKSIIVNTKYNCKFNHEIGDTWVENNFAELKKRYEARVENFYNYINNKPIVFFLHLRVNRMPVDKIYNLYKILEEKFSQTKFSLLIVNTSATDICFPETIKKYQIFHYHSPMPEGKYVWHNPQFYKTEAGLKFEYHMQAFVKNIIIDRY